MSASFHRTAMQRLAQEAEQPQIPGQSLLLLLLCVTQALPHRQALAYMVEHLVAQPEQQQLEQLGQLGELDLVGQLDQSGQPEQMVEVLERHSKELIHMMRQLAGPKALVKAQPEQSRQMEQSEQLRQSVDTVQMLRQMAGSKVLAQLPMEPELA